MEVLSNFTSGLSEMGVGNITSADAMNGSEASPELGHAGRFTYGERVVLAVAMSLIAVVGSLGNGLVILSVALSRKLRTATNVYVVSLSSTDLLTCLCLPWQVLGAASVNGWPIATWVCSAAGGLSIIFVGCSILTLAFIAVNRLYLITKSSVDYRKMYTLKFLIGTTLVAWALPAATVIIPPLFGTGRLGYDEKYLRCGPLQTDSGAWNPYDLIVSVVLYPIPMVTIVVSYCKIFLYINHHTKAILGPSEREPSSSSYPKTPTLSNGSSHQAHPPTTLKQQNSTRQRLSRRQVEITKNLFYVVCAFLLCLTPYSVGLFIPGAEHFTPYAGVIVLLNSCVNPVIYAAKHPHFRTVFRCLVTCQLSKIPEPARFLRCALSARSN